MRLVDVTLICVGLMLLIVGATGIGAESQEGSGCNFKDKGSAGDRDPLCYSQLIPGPEAPDMFVGLLSAGAMDADEEDNASAGIVFRNWRGFALKGNESHALRVSIESIRPIEPMNVRKLLASNMSIEEVRDEIRREEGSVMHQGLMKIGNEVYMLSNVSLSESGNYTELEADLSDQRRQDSEPQIFQDGPEPLGHISAKLAGKDDADVSAGTLVINSGEYAGQYKVLLSAQVPERMMAQAEDPGQGKEMNGQGPN